MNGLQGESLNGGGQLFVAKNKNVRVRVVTGDTLTAAIVLDRLPRDVKEVFLTGTSEISRAIAIYLCRRGVRVLVCCINASFCFLSMKVDVPDSSVFDLIQTPRF